MLSELSAIFLDLDGTLVESVGIKDQAFYELFSDYPEKLPEIMAYHTAHNAVVRFEKFKHIVSVILKEPLTEEREQYLARRFSDLVVDKIVETSSTPGAGLFLQKFLGLIPMVLISVTPDSELQEILERRNLFHYFTRVFGASWSKDRAMIEYMNEINARPENCIYIGDTAEDLEYARKAEVSFIGRNSGKAFPTPPPFLFEDMGDVAKQVEALFKIKRK